MLKRILLALVPLAVMLAAGAASAAAAGPVWSITSVSSPSSFHAGDAADQYTVAVTNVGGAASDGTPVTVTDVLPAGVSVVSVAGGDVFAGGLGSNLFGDASCDLASVSCTFEGSLDVGDRLTMTVAVAVAGSVSGSIVNSASVQGGGAPQASRAQSMQVGEAAAFGVAPGSTVVARSTDQAGAHPDLTTSFTFNQSSPAEPAGRVRNVSFGLPPGVIGNPRAVAQCSIQAIAANSCPSDAMVGSAIVTAELGPGFELILAEPIYSIRPYADEPAAFMFVALGIPVRLDASVRSDGDYGITVSSSNVTESQPVLGVSLTLWGVPADHNGPGPDSFDGPGPSEERRKFGGRGPGLRTALLTNPSLCAAGPSSADLSVSSWPESVQGVLQPAQSSSASASLAPQTGCEGLSFAPSLQVLPDTTQAGAPSGYAVDLHVPQNENPNALATPELKDATIALPPGTVVSPSAAGGLQACGEAQVALHSLQPASCPAASKLGTVEIETPLLASPLEGGVYLAEQSRNPFGSLLAIYLVAEGSGVTVKVAGEVRADPVSGRLTVSFKEAPQLPFSDLKVHLAGGPHAPLANPASCGEATSTSELSPWSSPFTPDATPSSSFLVAGCSAPQFAPSFSAGTTNNQAGAFSPLSVTFSRTDQDETLGAVKLETPPGLLGLLKSVPRCGEPQASQGACGQESLIGHTTVAAGPGPNPLYLGGQVYLTGPYGGAPFGLSVVVPAVAGPFDLGNVVVRAAIGVDPHTARITVTSDPLPSILQGIPLQIRTVNVTIDREGFTFNPTNCEPLSVAGTITSTQGASVGVSSRFQAANCATLPFKPSFTVSTQASTSKKNGASLDVKVGYPSGSQANIRSVAVALPKQLPSRLTTIRQACPQATFAANPASCPTGSNIGIATAHTPVLANPVTGPAYLVSHGGAAFPDLVVILQGEGITLELVGNINIKKGVTSSAFASVPDAPISSFELKLPEGPHSGLTAALPAKARGSLCGTSLTMPTTLTGQNGAVVKQSTKIAVTGCPKAKTRRAHGKKAHRPAKKRTPRAHGKKRKG